MAGNKCLTSALSAWVKRQQTRGGFENNLAQVRVISAKEGYVKTAMKVEPEHCNEKDMMHGGMAALLVDTISSMALHTHDLKTFGVSVDLNVSYLAVAKLGSEIIITSESLKRGKNLAFLTVNINDDKTGKLLVTGRHSKFTAI